MNATLEFLKINAKAIAGFVAGLILNAVQAVLSGQAPWPKTMQEWVTYLGTSLLAGVMVWVTGNKLTVTQITTNAVKQGVTVITQQAIETAADAAAVAVHTATGSLPTSAADPVNLVAKEVSDTVTNVLKGVADNFPGDLLKNVA